MKRRVLAIAVLVLSLGALAAGITAMRASGAARDWPVAQGTVVSRDVGPSTTTGASRPGSYVEPRVTYRFTVDGKPYTGHRIALTTKAYDEAQARRIADAFPDQVDVHYNPRDPSDALLDPGGRGPGLLLLIGGALGLLVGAALLFVRATG